MSPNLAVELAAKERKEHIENVSILRRAPGADHLAGGVQYQRGFASNYFSLRSRRSFAASPTGVVPPPWTSGYLVPRCGPFTKQFSSEWKGSKQTKSKRK